MTATITKPPQHFSQNDDLETQVKTVIVVEDDQVLAETLARRLDRQGYLTKTAADADSVLAALPQFSGDIYLLDLRLGQSSGLSLIEPIRQHYPDAQIVVMTGFASIATAVSAIKLGADDYLPKPLDFKLLLATLNGGQSADVDVSAGQVMMSPDRLEWEHIQKVLSDNDNNISVTARQLGMHRRTLQRKLAKHPVDK